MCEKSNFKSEASRDEAHVAKHSFNYKVSLDIMKCSACLKGYIKLRLYILSTSSCSGLEKMRDPDVTPASHSHAHSRYGGNWRNPH